LVTRSILIWLALLALPGCVTLGDAGQPITMETVRAPQPGPESTVVIVLPGFGVDVVEMRERGIAQAIQSAWPHADVVLANANFAYYRARTVVLRLHDDVVTPVRAKGYRHVWLAGASMGGLGALLYEREHPGLLAGVVLFAPFLGEPPLLEEIRAAGGVQKWEPGELASELDLRNYQRHLWKRVRAIAEKPELARRVWLACGTDDFLRSGAQLLATALPQSNFIEEPGGHTWKTWTRLTKSVFSRIQTAEAAAPAL
jgi:pimeloyl-ACP methyl ester carboxylesterase